MHISSLRQPGYPFYFWTRGFASPDYSGFARSENVYKLRLIEQHLALHFEQKSTGHSIKKERSYLPKIRALLVSVNTGCQDAYLISSATRLSFLFLDPWLCVAGLLRFCPFGERCFNDSCN